MKNASSSYIVWPTLLMLLIANTEAAEETHVCGGVVQRVEGVGGRRRGERGHQGRLVGMVGRRLMLLLLLVVVMVVVWVVMVRVVVVVMVWWRRTRHGGMWRWSRQLVGL